MSDQDSRTPSGDKETSHERRSTLRHFLHLPDPQAFEEDIRSEIQGNGSFNVWPERVEEFRERYNLSKRMAAKGLEKVVREVCGNISLEGYFGARKEIEALVSRFAISSEGTSRALKLRALQLWEGEIESAASDGRVTDDESTHLNEQAERLGLNIEEKKIAYESVANKLFNDKLSKLLQDDMISPDEDAELTDLIVGLNIHPTFDQATVDLLNDARRGWAINQGPLPSIEVPLGLQKGERAHAAVRATAFEERTRTTHVGWSGTTVRIKIMRGWYYRSSFGRLNRVAQDYQHSLGNGQLVITNKRLIFAGDDYAKSARLTSILKVEGYVDGIRVLRSAGRPITYVFIEADPWFAAILERARDDASGRGERAE